jgi:hypothetical protein
VADTEKTILDRVIREPGYRRALYKILKYCETPRLISDVEHEIRVFPEMKTAIHEPHVLLGWLEDVGGIERVAPGRGEEAEEEIEEETQEKWRTTQAGKKVAEMEAPHRKLLKLLAGEPSYRQIYVQVLDFCQSPRKRTEIEELLKGNPAMEKPQVYPSFFIEGLENTGGLEWIDNRWWTTEAGKGVLG